jgi:hypothetical protein
MIKIKGTIRSMFCLLALAILLFGCDRDQEAGTPSPDTLSPAASSGTLTPAASPFDPVSTGKAVILKAGHSIATGKVMDGAGYGWEPGISFAIKADGTLWSWGYRVSADRDYPEQIRTERSVVQVTNSYVLTDDGQVRRMNESGTEALTAVEGLEAVVSISQLDEMFGSLFALKQDGTVWYLERDTGKLSRFGDYTSIAAIYGTSFSLFLQDSDGKLLYANGQQGNVLEPEKVTVILPRGASQVAAGYADEALIRTKGGEVLLFLPAGQKIQPEPRAAEAKRMAVAAEGLYLFTKEDGTVWGFGKNKNGILGKQADIAAQPVQINGLKDIVDIQAGTDHVLAMDKNGQVYSWGSNMTGQLGRLAHEYKEWTELGELANIRQAVTVLDRPYFILDNDTVWGMDAGHSLYEVKGVSGVKGLTGIRERPLSLGRDGIIRIWSKQFETSEPLPLSFKVKEMVEVHDKLLVLSTDGSLQVITFDLTFKSVGGEFLVESIKPIQTDAVKAQGGWSARIKSLHANPYTFLALTEDGKVFYTDWSKEQGYIFKSVMGLPSVKALAAEDYIAHVGDSAAVWALDQNNQVHEIRMDLDWKTGTSRVTKTVVQPEKESGVAQISGRLMIMEDGSIQERGGKSEKPASPVRLVSSIYSYGSEGPGFHYQLIVTDHNKIAVLGYNPFGEVSHEPGLVAIP